MSASRVLAVLLVVLIVAVAAVTAAYYFGVISLPDTSLPADRVVVMGVAPDPAGGDTVVFAAQVGPGRRVTALDVDTSATVPGTSASTARQAYAFGGGEAVASALAPQTGGRALSWLVLPEEKWERLLDSAGGVKVEVPAAVSTYADGSLVSLRPGAQSLSAVELLALVRSADYLTQSQADRVRGQVRTGVADALETRIEDLASASQAEGVSSGPSVEDVSAFLQSL